MNRRAMWQNQVGHKQRFAPRRSISLLIVPNTHIESRAIDRIFRCHREIWWLPNEELAGIRSASVGA
jgi:hypothetical protein